MRVLATKSHAAVSALLIHVNSAESKDRVININLTVHRIDDPFSPATISFDLAPIETREIYILPAFN